MDIITQKQTTRKLAKTRLTRSQIHKKTATDIKVMCLLGATSTIRLVNVGWENREGWEFLLANREKPMLLSSYMDDLEIVGKAKNTPSLWKVVGEALDPDPSFSF